MAIVQIGILFLLLLECRSCTLMDIASWSLLREMTPRICQALSRNVSNGQSHELCSTSVADSRPSDRWAGRGPCHPVGRMLACLEIHCRDEQTAIESLADLVVIAVIELAIAA